MSRDWSCGAMLAACLLLGTAACGELSGPAGEEGAFSAAEQDSRAAELAALEQAQRAGPKLKYDIVGLGMLPGDTSSRATAINDLGQVVGTSTLFGAGRRGFIWEESTGMVDLGPFPGADSVVPTDINEAGAVVGYAEGWAGEFEKRWTRPFAWYQGQLIELPTIYPGDDGGALAINDLFQIVGFSRDPVSSVGTAVAWWWNGAPYDLGFPKAEYVEASDVNDWMQAVGSGYFWWGAASPLPVPAGYTGWSSTLLINDNGLIAGTTVNRAAKIENGTATLLPKAHPTADWWLSASAEGLNDQGEIVGQEESADGLCAVLWLPDGQVIDLNTVLKPNSGWSGLRWADDINNDGWVVGFGFREPESGASEAFLLKRKGP